jgi:transcriptional regulator with XRE-family HTH domain
MEVGKRIRSLRKERKLSLEEISKRSGVGLATLSRIETGKGSGTFRTHQRIADALEVALPELYRGLEESEAEAVLTKPEQEGAETFTYDEKASAILLTTQASAKRMMPQLIALQPGGRTALEEYPHGTERWLFGLEGKPKVTVGEKEYRLAKGTTLYFRASLPHRLLNTERTSAKVISVMSPVVL